MRGGGPAPARRWAGAAAELVERAPESAPGWDPVQVLGGPGTGKTSLLVDTATARLRSPGTHAESVLVLTSSTRAARAVRAQVTAGLVGPGGHTVREPLVRTVHSYAFAVLRLQAARHGNPPPRLVTAPEQDAVVRELLRGDVADGAPGWPPRLRPALGLTGFATELRNLLLRAAERGAGPEDLVRLGRTHARPEWVAAGRFGVQLEQSGLLRGAVGVEAPQASAPAVDAAGLISAAVDALHSDTGLRTQERARVRHLLIDDAQHLDAGAAALVRLLGRGAEVVVAGDPDQAVFGFRGAEVALLTEAGERPNRRVLLSTTYRCAPAVARAVAAISARLPGAGIQREPVAAEGRTGGTVTVRVLASPAQEAAVVADVLRRAHLLDGVPYPEMAVVVRSTQRSLPPLRRALLAAGVPLAVPRAELPLARQHAVAGFLLVLRALTDGAGFDAHAALALLASPIGGADPVALRRLQRGVRRGELAAGGDTDSAELLRVLLIDPRRATAPGLSAAELAPLNRVRTVLTAARAPLEAGLGVEEVLWAAWTASGVQRRWVGAARRGGTAGAQADRDLDAVVALFDAAARYVDRLPAASVAGFVDYLAEQEIAGDLGPTGAPQPEAVTVLTAHSAAGQQWRVVVVAGVQEGLWPSLRTRGSLLGVQELTDELSGGPGPELAGTVSRTAPLLAEERRLFLLACSRAAESLVVTAVRSSTGDAELVPSRFLDELVPLDTPEGDDSAAAEPPGRGLVLGELVAELRAAVTDPHAEATRRGRAGVQLARLAAAGVPGAHPDQWYGRAEPSTDAPLWADPDAAVAVSPSVVELLATCPLRWMLERHGGHDGSAASAVAGTLVHTLVQAIAGRTPAAEVDAALAATFSSVELGAPWFAAHELERTRGMLETFRAWWQGSRGELSEVGTEVEVDATVTGTSTGGADVTARVRGRIDRLERDADGRLVVVDVKTGKTPITQEAAAEHPQLATYQLAAAEGGVDGHPERAAPGGARLVYVAKAHRSSGAAVRSQPAPTTETVQAWRQQVLDAAAATRGPTFTATVNDGCQHCPVAASCPAQGSGRQVTGP